MPEGRPAIPAAVDRAVRVEAGHRCAVTTCRATSGLELHHIVDWSISHDDSFQNLILLCAVCHARVTKGEIDRRSVQAYKSNLALLAGRYSDLERRVLEHFATHPGEPTITIDMSHEILLRYLIQDGILEHLGPAEGAFKFELTDDDETVFGPASWQLTEEGEALVARLRAAQSLD